MTGSEKRFPTAPSAAQAFDLSSVFAVAVPAGVDRDVLLDGLLTFVEDKVAAIEPTTALAIERVAWMEVPPDEFELSCAVCVGAKGRGLLVHAVATDGKLAVIPDDLSLAPEDWGGLVETLCAAQDEQSDCWDILQLPSIQHASSPRVVPALSRVDRRLPIRASAEQRAQLATARAMPDQRHPVIAMRPIKFRNPDSHVLHATLEALQERHEILHMSFSVMDMQDYICLTDDIPTPFDIQDETEALEDLAKVGRDHSKHLSREGFPTKLPWRARLLTDGNKGVLVCLFSEAISDTKTLDLLRDEIVQFYKAFRSGTNPETRWPAPDLQYTDYAGNERLRPPRPSGKGVVETASDGSASRILQHIPHETLGQLEQFAVTNGIAVRTILLAAFQRTLNDLIEVPVSRIMVAVHDRRPVGAGQMLGQFSLDCPMWFGLGEASGDLALIQGRLARILAAGQSQTENMDALHAKLPASDRVFRFDGAGRPRLVPVRFASASVSLTVLRSQDNVALEWLIRDDDPLSATPQILMQTISRHINAILETDCSYECSNERKVSDWSGSLP